MQSESHNPSWWLRDHLPSQLPAQKEMLGDVRQHHVPRPECPRSSPGCELGDSSVGGCQGPALPWVLADAGVQAGATAGQLVLPLCPHQLKPQRLLKLPWLFGGEVDLQFHLTEGRHYPAVPFQPGN